MKTNEFEILNEEKQVKRILSVISQDKFEYAYSNIRTFCEKLLANKNFDVINYDDGCIYRWNNSVIFILNKIRRFVAYNKNDGITHASSIWLLERFMHRTSARSGTTIIFFI